MATLVEPLSGSGDASPPRARLLISCADRPGIVAAVSGFLAEEGANIVASDQYSTDPWGGAFLMRIEFSPGPANHADLAARFADVADQFGMTWRMWHSSQRKRVALMVSRLDHCLLDLLWRWRRGELECDIPLVVSNHPDLHDDVAMFGVRYVHIPVPRGGKPQAEARVLEALGDEYDLIVLARYMQILSPAFLAAAGTPIINIHHSFLPAFAGADPHARARERGVKLIGSHRALRHRGARRGPDHRAGHGAREPSRQRRGAHADRARHRAGGAGPRSQMAARGPRPRRRQPHGRVPVTALALGRA